MRYATLFGRPLSEAEPIWLGMLARGELTPDIYGVCAGVDELLRRGFRWEAILRIMGRA